MCATKGVKISGQRDFSKISSSFRQSFSSTTNFLKRRFSSGDLQGENEDFDVGTAGQDSLPNRQPLPPQHQQPISGPQYAPPGPNPQPGPIPTRQPGQPPSSVQGSDMSLNFSMKSSTTSAPTSPAKNVSSFLSRATSLTSSVTSNVTGMASRISSQIKESGKHKVLLVIDDLHTDW